MGKLADAAVGGVYQTKQGDLSDRTQPSVWWESVRGACTDAGLDVGDIDGLIGDCVKRLGSTAVAITHDMASARRIGDVIAMLHQGRIVWSGPPSELMNSGNPVVDQFVHGRREGPIQMELRR